jgi:hypothetical protein
VRSGSVGTDAAATRIDGLDACACPDLNTIAWISIHAIVSDASADAIAEARLCARSERVKYVDTTSTRRAIEGAPPRRDGVVEVELSPRRTDCSPIEQHHSAPGCRFDSLRRHLTCFIGSRPSVLTRQSTRKERS